MDEGVGRIAEALRQNGQWDNTLFIFTSDNGFQCGHHGIWGKGNGTWPFNAYEEAVRVPMIFHHPARIPGGRVSAALAGGYDLYPTLLSYAGIAPAPHSKRPGRDLCPLLYGERQTVQDRLVIYDEYGPLRMLRSSKWKYVHFLDGHPDLLYDLEEDPGELENLAGRADPGRLRALRGMLEEWFDSHGEPDLARAARHVTGTGQNRRATEPGAWRAPYPTKAERKR